MSRIKSSIAALLLLHSPLVISSASAADMVQLQQGTATYSQTCCNDNPPPYSPSMSIDGIFSDPSGSQNGWSVYEPDLGSQNQIAVWETESDVGPGLLSFKMYFLHSNPTHLLGRFRFSVTADDRDSFADGLASNGDVTANWLTLDAQTISIPLGMTYTVLSDSSILIGGTVPGTGVYDIQYQSTLSNITGIRLEVMEDESLPAGMGPGFYSLNGNFVLTELELYITPVPEPEIYGMIGLGLALLGWVGRRKSLSA